MGDADRSMILSNSPRSSPATALGTVVDLNTLALGHNEIRSRPMGHFMPCPSKVRGNYYLDRL